MLVFMIKILKNDFEKLLVEVVNYFKSLLVDKMYTDEQEKEHLSKQLQINEKLFSLMSAIENRTLNGVHIRPIVNIVELIRFYIMTFEYHSSETINKEYKEILQSYINLVGPEYIFDNVEIRNRVNGLKNIKKRYENNLYKKREILYRVLRDTASKNGRWSNINQAVRDVYPILQIEFDQFNKKWILAKMSRLKEQIKYNEVALRNNKKPEFDNGQINFQNRTFENKILKCKQEYKKLEKALKTNDITAIMGKTLAFHSDYQEESIINHLRNCPDLLKDIIIDKT